MKCKICGRPLKNAQSSRNGYGPVCYRKMFGNRAPVKHQKHNMSSGDSTYCLIPGQMKVEEYLQVVGVIQEKESAFATLPSDS